MTLESYLQALCVGNGTRDHTETTPGQHSPDFLDACRRTANPCEQSLAEHDVVRKPAQV
jgi:hypothetical protein